MESNRTFAVNGSIFNQYTNYDCDFVTCQSYLRAILERIEFESSIVNLSKLHFSSYVASRSLDRARDPRLITRRRLQQRHRHRNDAARKSRSRRC